MAADFQLFGVAHLLILAAVAAVALGLVCLGRRRPAAARAIRLALGLFLLVNESVWYAFRLSHEGFRFPYVLPLQLCDVALWLTVVSALTLKPWCFEIAYFAGLGGSSMAIVTPELWAPLSSYPSIYFFLGHGFVVITLSFLAGSRQARLRPGSLWRVFGLLNTYAAAVALFNLKFHTNYLFLCEKPDSATLLDYLGPWPFYILGAEAVALLVFTLLWLPQRPAVESR